MGSKAKVFVWVGWGQTTFWRSSNSLYLNPNDSNLDFDNWNDLANRNGNYSGSVVLLALCLERFLPAAKLAPDILKMSLQGDIFFLFNDIDVFKQTEKDFQGVNLGAGLH